MADNPLSPSTPASRAPSAGTSGSRFSPVDPIRVLRQHLWLLVAAMVVSVILGGGIWFLLLRLSPRYTSEGQLTITGGISDPYQLIQQSGGMGDLGIELIDTFIKNQIVRILSDEVIEGALRRDDVRATALFRSMGDNTRRARDAVKGALTVDRIKGSTLIYVTYSAGNIADPPVILDAVLAVYLEKLALDSGRESDSVRLTFVRERDRAEESVRQIEEQIKQFTLQNDLSALETRNHEASISYKSLAEERAKLLLELETVREIYVSLVSAQRSGRVGHSPQKVAEVDMAPSVAIRNERIMGLQEQRGVLLERFGENHRSVREINQQILATQQEKNRQVDKLLRQNDAVMLEQARSQISSLEAQLQSIQPKIDESRAQIRDLGLKLEEYRRLKERAATATDRLSKVEQLLNSMRIQTDRPDSTQIRIVFRATEAELSFPKPVLVIPGVVLLVLGSVCGVVFLRESLDQRVKRSQDVSLLLDCDLLGVVPEAAEDPFNPGDVEGIVRIDPTGLLAESFRQARVAMLAQMERRGDRVILLAGAQPSCGTSVVAHNLAISAAYEGRKVLLLDANFLHPTQHKLFGITVGPGLMELLDGTNRFEDVVVRVDTPPIEVVPAGYASGSALALIEGGAFGDLLGHLRTIYDVILIDTPPALVTSDASLIAKHTDSVVVVIRALQDKRGMVARMLRQFRSHGTVVLGAILNGVRSSAGGYFRKNYQVFYNYCQDGAAARSKDIAAAEFVEATVEDE